MAVTSTDLAEAELRIFQAKRDQRRQREILERSENHEQAFAAAKALLMAMELTLANLITYRDFIARDLDRQTLAERPSRTAPPMFVEQRRPGTSSDQP